MVLLPFFFWGGGGGGGLGLGLGLGKKGLHVLLVPGG